VPESVAAAQHFLANLSPGLAALLAAVVSAVLTSTATYLWQVRRERKQRVREMRGIAKLLNEEVEVNRRQLSAASKGAPPPNRNPYQYVPSTSVWDKANLRIAQLLEELGDDDLLTSLVKYYTQAHKLADFIQVGSGAPKATMTMISHHASYLMELSDDVQFRLQELVGKLDK
jgi:hypothetical protein